MDTSLRAYTAVDLKAIQGNAKAIKTHTGKQLIAVVKADAYGHGAVPVAKALHTIADMFAVATTTEGIALRQAGICKPILILFSPLLDWAEEIVANKLTPAIDNWHLAKRLNEIADAAAQNVKVHVDINTGMNRSGVRHTEAGQFIKRLQTLHRLEIEGIFTHFATADEIDKSYAYLQRNRFASLLSSVSPLFKTVPLRHAANSAAVLAIPESHLDAVRPGLSLYGIYPSVEKPVQLQPALTWKARIGWIDCIEPGEGVSYGLTYKASERTRIAGLQIGYGDGYPCALADGGEVLIGGTRCPVIGRICMDVTVVRLALSSNVSVGDEAVLIGKQGNKEIKIYEVADRANTTPYEILTNIGKRVHRIYPEIC